MHINISFYMNDLFIHLLSICCSPGTISVIKIDNHNILLLIFLWFGIIYIMYILYRNYNIYIYIYTHWSQTILFVFSLRSFLVILTVTAFPKACVPSRNVLPIVLTLSFFQGRSNIFPSYKPLWLFLPNVIFPWYGH